MENDGYFHQKELFIDRVIFLHKDLKTGRYHAWGRQRVSIIHHLIISLLVEVYVDTLIKIILNHQLVYNTKKLKLTSINKYVNGKVNYGVVDTGCNLTEGGGTFLYQRVDMYLEGVPLVK